MNRIVVGFDGSDESRDALRLGRALARVEGADLVVAVAFAYAPLPMIDAGGSERALAEHFDRVFSEVEDELGGEEFVRRELPVGSPARALSELAASEGAELIVIGSTHRGRLGRIYPGSVGERLLEGAQCAIAIAPRGFARGEHLGIGMIGVAYDGSDESKLALGEAEHLAGELGASLTLIGVVPQVESSADRVGKTAAEYREALRRHFRDVLDDAVARLSDSEAVEAVLDEGDPAAALAARGVELDLLVMGSRGYGPLRRVLLGGTSAEVIRTAPCPVMVVPRPGDSAPDDSHAAATETAV